MPSFVPITDPFPDAGHDHQRCQAAILADAEHLCWARRVRLTAQRRRVLEIVAEHHRAVGAYEILEKLAEDGRRPAPISVYRALDFLIGQGLVHRLASLNAYVACQNPSTRHGAWFLICRHCGMIGEMADSRVGRAIVAAASDRGFAVSAPVVEVAGLCVNCRERVPDGARA